MAENNNYPDTVDSRSVKIIETIINQEEYDIPPKSRLEEVLLELKEAIEQGGSGGSITIDPTPTQGSSNAVSSGGVYAALQGVSPIDYSTTEQNTGRKWIDGKPIYQKTFVPTAPATYWEGINNAVDVSELNIDNLINTEGQGQNPNNGVYFTISMVSTPGNTIVMNLTKSSITVYLGDSGSPTRVFNFTIWYTKTTDTAE